MLYSRFNHKNLNNKVIEYVKHYPFFFLLTHQRILVNWTLHFFLFLFSVTADFMAVFVERGSFLLSEYIQILLILLLNSEI